MAALTFLLDGVNFLTYGVHVTKASNLFSIPKLKDRLVGDWQNSNGKIYDTATPFFEERTITLECYIPAISRIDVNTKIQAFKTALIASGLRRLWVKLDSSNLNNILAFNVLLSGEIQVSNSFDSVLNIAKFSITLVEPEPRKRVYRVVANGQITLTFNCSTIHNVYTKTNSYLDKFSSATVQETLVANDLVCLCGDPADLSISVASNLSFLYSV